MQRADGSVGVITGWKPVAGTKTMYNLEVQQDHTFVVGDGEWVVHNECDRGKLKTDLGPSRFQAEAHHIAPCELVDQPGNFPSSTVADFMNSAIRGGWELNGAADNGINLPINDLDGINNGLPTHYATGGHWGYTYRVYRFILDVIRGIGGTPSDIAAAGMMRQITGYLRGQIIQAGQDAASADISCVIEDVLF